MKLLSNIQFEFERRMIEESYSRILQCTSLLSDKEIWLRPNENLVSIGNLILHLEGNIRQWILTGIAGEEDSRKRDREFSETGPIDKTQILSQLKNALDLANEVIKKLSLDDLSLKKKVQGFDESVLSIIIHVIEHMSYHTGQITFFTKELKNIDTQYYGGLDLNIKNS